MLDNEAKTKLQRIRQLFIQMFGNECEFGELEIIDSPYSEFELSVYLYGCIDVGICYDRSALDIGIKQDGKYVLLEKFTSKQVFYGMKATRPENLVHNFEVLKEVVEQLRDNPSM